MRGFCFSPESGGKSRLRLLSTLRKGGGGGERGRQTDRQTDKYISYPPSVCDLLRNIVLARGWSEGLNSMFKSLKKEGKRKYMNIHLVTKGSRDFQFFQPSIANTFKDPGKIQ